MSPTSDFQGLFKSSGVSDKIAQLQSLLASRDLSSEEALALLGSIHEDLKLPQEEAQVYQRYAEMMASLKAAQQGGPNNALGSGMSGGSGGSSLGSSSLGGSSMK